MKDIPELKCDGCKSRDVMIRELSEEIDRIRRNQPRPQGKSSNVVNIDRATNSSPLP